MNEKFKKFMNFIYIFDLVFNVIMLYCMLTGSFEYNYTMVKGILINTVSLTLLKLCKAF